MAVALTHVRAPARCAPVQYAQWVPLALLAQRFGYTSLAFLFGARRAAT